MILQHPTISICIPTFNRAALLDQTLQSVANQTKKPYEVIIVDNASSDNTEEIVQKYKKFGFKFIKNDKNVGMVENWNKCIKKAQGEYLTFLHSDDLIAPNWYEVWDNIIKKKRFYFYTSPFAIVDINNKPLYTCWPFRQDHHINKNDVFKEFFNNLSPHLPPTAANIYHKSIFKDIGLFNPRLKTESDVFLSLEVFRKYDIYYHAEILFAYRTHASHGFDKKEEKTTEKNELMRFENYLSIIHKYYSAYFNNRDDRYFFLVPVFMTLAPVNLYLIKLKLKKIVGHYRIALKNFPDLLKKRRDWLWFFKIQIRFIQRALFDRFIPEDQKRELNWLKDIKIRPT